MVMPTENDKSHEHQFVYVSLSKSISLEGLYMTYRDKYIIFFYHAYDKIYTVLRNEFFCLECNF